MGRTHSRPYDARRHNSAPAPLRTPVRPSALHSTTASRCSAASSATRYTERSGSVRRPACSKPRTRRLSLALPPRRAGDARAWPRKARVDPPSRLTSSYVQHRAHSPYSRAGRERGGTRSVACGFHGTICHRSGRRRGRSGRGALRALQVARLELPVPGRHVQRYLESHGRE